MGIKALSVSDLEAIGPRGSVWVLNTASSSEYELHGTIMVSVPKKNGPGDDAMKVPETWLPVDLTSQFPKDRLLESSEFRSAVEKGFLTIISEKQARAILAQDGAKDEKRRLQAAARFIREASAARSIDPKKTQILNSEGLDADAQPADIYGQDSDEGINVAQLAQAGLDDVDGFKPSFLMFFDRLKLARDVEALNAIRTRGKFSKKELRHLRDNLKKHPKTVQAIRDRLKLYKVAKASKTAKAA